MPGGSGGLLEPRNPRPKRPSGAEPRSSRARLAVAPALTCGERMEQPMHSCCGSWDGSAENGVPFQAGGGYGPGMGPYGTPFAQMPSPGYGAISPAQYAAMGHGVPTYSPMPAAMRPAAMAPPGMTPGNAASGMPGLIPGGMHGACDPWSSDASAMGSRMGGGMGGGMGGAGVVPMPGMMDPSGWHPPSAAGAAGGSLMRLGVAAAHHRLQPQGTPAQADTQPPTAPYPTQHGGGGQCGPHGGPNGEAPRSAADLADGLESGIARRSCSRVRLQDAAGKEVSMEDLRCARDVRGRDGAFDGCCAEGPAAGACQGCGFYCGGYGVRGTPGAQLMAAGEHGSAPAACGGVWGEAAMMGGMLAPMGAYGYMQPRDMSQGVGGGMGGGGMGGLGVGTGASSPATTPAGDAARDHAQASASLQLHYLPGFDPQSFDGRVYGAQAVMAMQRQQMLPYVYGRQRVEHWGQPMQHQPMPAQAHPAAPPGLMPATEHQGGRGMLVGGPPLSGVAAVRREGVLDAAPLPPLTPRAEPPPATSSPAAPLDMTESLRALGLEPRPYKTAAPQRTATAHAVAEPPRPTAPPVGASRLAPEAAPAQAFADATRSRVDASDASSNLSPSGAVLGVPSETVLGACVSCEPALVPIGKDKLWASMNNSERAAARALGWAAASWDAGERTGVCSISWVRLTVAARRAAAVLGYEEEDWNAEVLADAQHESAEDSGAVTQHELEARATLANHLKAHPPSLPADRPAPPACQHAAPPSCPPPPSAASVVATEGGKARAGRGAAQKPQRPTDAPDVLASPHALNALTAGPAPVASGVPAQRVPRAGPPRVRTLLLHKASVESKLGLSLRGDGGAPPVVSASSGLAAAAGLRVGESVLSVNGQRIDDHEHATELMRKAEGAVRLRVARMVNGDGLGGEAANGTSPLVSQVPEPPADAPPEIPLPPMRVSFVTVQKQTSSSVVGIRLVGRVGCPPYIAQLTAGAASVAAAMGELGLKVGQALLSVNGAPVRSAAAGDRALAEAVGRVELELGEEPDPLPRAPKLGAPVRRVEAAGKAGGADPPAPYKTSRPKPKQPAASAPPTALLTQVPRDGVATGGAVGAPGEEARGGKKQFKRKSSDKDATEVQVPGKAAGGASKPLGTAVKDVRIGTEPSPAVKDVPMGTDDALRPATNGADGAMPKPKGKPKKSVTLPAAPTPAATLTSLLPPPCLSDMLDARPPAQAGRLAAEPAAPAAVVAPGLAQPKKGRGGGRNGRGRGRGQPPQSTPSEKAGV